ncbi:ROK family transcriptional regulator [Natronosporangium hydrolyticum]|uniref:ROK family transcriptional regulator n=1 Tax=Natronosporangium hydrolyticum TaxID=2811111 RepID=UPI001EFA1E90|nr:ROK family transcriptional regulator [Natronosporangium hydrolyticum]
MITPLSTPQPADFADVRATNLAVALRYVRAHAPCSRADIAAATGLNKATVSSLVTDLLERRLVTETGLTEHRIGRPATMLMLDNTYAAVGLEVNTDHLTAVALDLAGERLLSWRRSFPGATATPGKTISALTALARRALNRVAAEDRRLLGVTVGVPGLVEPDGVVSVAPSLGWRDVDLRGQLARSLPTDTTFPVSVDNDANLAATAEYRWGDHAGAGHLAYLTGQTGIGAGIIVDGQLLRGARGLAGELGHLPLDPAGPVCGCGRRGCLEALTGVGALLRRADPESFIDGVPSDWEPELTELIRRAKAEEKEVTAALTEVGGWLGHAAGVLANLLNPEVIMLGGYFVPLAPWLLPAARAQLALRALAPDAGGAQLVAGTLGHDATAIGGAAKILAAVDAGHLPTAE